MQLNRLKSMSLRGRFDRGNLLEKGKIAEPVPNEVRNLAPGLLRLRLATSLAMTIPIPLMRIHIASFYVITL
jgi:hypothetical protein